MSSSRYSVALILGVAFVSGCTGQPASVPSAEGPAPDAPAVYFEADLIETPGLVPEAEKPLVLEIEPGGQEPVTVRYARGVQEEVRWAGSGRGVAELRNQYGQLVYRVREGGEGFSGTIPAGLYTLAVQGGDPVLARDLVFEPQWEGGGQRREIFWRESAPTDRGTGTQSFAYANLTDQDFSGRTLGGVSFRGARLKRVSFAGANVSFTRFEDAHFMACNFDGADLKFATFERTTLERCSYQGADLSSSDFQEAYVLHTSMQGANLDGSNFDESSLVYTNFEGANLLNLNVYRSGGTSITGVCSCSPGCGLSDAAGHFTDW